MFAGLKNLLLFSTSERKSRFFAEPALPALSEVEGSGKKQILRGVYPERSQKQILRFAQNDKRRAQNNSVKVFSTTCQNAMLAAKRGCGVVQARVRLRPAQQRPAESFRIRK
ncbi:MAG: hypothetical protein A3J28_01000 [Acidobacteria bacterium RIFCSPLOWO2_12_FULL_60_22]|nr:MAG: hypothetical protein A3J28_01000 [Acidobacteria bacterium RIFCSPLOWO2_12_FULL_60_22]